MTSIKLPLSYRLNLEGRVINAFRADSCPSVSAICLGHMSVDAHIDVATAPGEIEFTRMPFGLPSRAALVDDSGCTHLSLPH